MSARKKSLSKGKAKKHAKVAPAKALKAGKGKTRPKPAPIAKSRAAKNKAAPPKARSSARSKPAATVRAGILARPRPLRVLPQAHPAFRHRHKIRVGNAY